MLGFLQAAGQVYLVVEQVSLVVEQVSLVAGLRAPGLVRL